MKLDLLAIKSVMGEKRNVNPTKLEGAIIENAIQAGRSTFPRHPLAGQVGLHVIPVHRSGEHEAQPLYPAAGFRGREIAC